MKIIYQSISRCHLEKMKLKLKNRKFLNSRDYSTMNTTRDRVLVHSSEWQVLSVYPRSPELRSPELRSPELRSSEKHFRNSAENPLSPELRSPEFLSPEHISLLLNLRSMNLTHWTIRSTITWYSTLIALLQVYIGPLEPCLLNSSDPVAGLTGTKAAFRVSLKWNENGDWGSPLTAGLSSV